MTSGVTYRVRGGPQQADALFAPTTKTPWTDDFQLSYETDLGQERSFMALYTRRRTRDIIEDYDLALYAFRDDGTTTYPGPVEHPDSLFLGLDYFGYDAFPESNFIIATLAGGRRDYQGVEFTFRQRLRENWQALAAYTFGDATGNTNSDSNADFQGDVIWLDPRAPHQVGVQPGSIAHLFKLSSSYTWDQGFQIGSNWRWNAGTVASRTFRASGRNLPVRVDPGRGVRLRRHHAALALAGGGRHPPQPRVRPRRHPAALQLPLRRLPAGAVRRHLQPVRHPGRHPQPGPARGRRRQRLWRRHPLHPPAAHVPRRPAQLLGKERPAVRDPMTTLPSMPLLPGHTPRRTGKALAQ